MIDSDGPAEETSRRYRNPPIEHRFRKGVSGNPKGRPRKSHAQVSTKIGGKPSVGFEDRVKSLAIEAWSKCAPNASTTRKISALWFPGVTSVRG